MRKVAEVAPLGTVTEGGPVAIFELLLPKVTTKPFGGAGPLSITVPVAVVPPPTGLGDTVTPETSNGRRVSVAFSTIGPAWAVMVGRLTVLTGKVEIVKLPEEEPAGMVNVFCTVATVLFEERATVAPPANIAIGV
jgi:hypothetical protein